MTQGRGKLQVEMVGVGHGDCFILKWEPAEGEASVVVVDGGPKGGAEPLAKALSELGAKRVDMMVVSHTDADHIDGLAEYVGRGDSLPVARYWGPCVPAFERHDWLFAKRIKRGLKVAKELEATLAAKTTVSWPVEGAAWQSQDGGLRIKVLSPAGRLIEKLLTSNDVVSLFTAVPMLTGWLLDPPSPVGPEDRFAALRAAIARGEFGPGDLPAGFEASSRSPGTDEFDPDELAEDHKHRYGSDPEFFGNDVLNDTSIVLMVEADVGAAPRRMLFTGDLQSFTYLMAKHPMGLGAEIVKAPHHGSRSHVGEKIEAYDEVWQWLRPRAVMVSASGKHGLPRQEFRQAALRTGAMLFCACERGEEVLIGEPAEGSCNKAYGCGRAKRGVRLEWSADRLTANAQACAGQSSNTTPPVIQMVQHIVEPSTILERMSTAERDEHVGWMTKLLTQRHDERQAAGSEPDLEPIDLEDVKREARLLKRFRAAADIETVAEAAARAGKIWLSPPEPFGRPGRSAWIVPTEAQWREIREWLLGHAAIVLLISNRKVGRTKRELLLAADTSYLAARVSERFGFPSAMFCDIVWPRISADLTKANWEVRSRDIGNDFTIVLCTPGGIADAFERIVERLPADIADEYLNQITYYTSLDSIHFPDDFEEVITPYARSGSNLALIKMNISSRDISKVCRQDGLISHNECHDYFSSSYIRSSGAPDPRRGLAAMLLSGFGEAIKN